MSSPGILFASFIVSLHYSWLCSAQSSSIILTSTVSTALFPTNPSTTVSGEIATHTVTVGKVNVLLIMFSSEVNGTNCGLCWISYLINTTQILFMQMSAMSSVYLIMKKKKNNNIPNWNSTQSFNFFLPTIPLLVLNISNLAYHTSSQGPVRSAFSPAFTLWMES